MTATRTADEIPPWMYTLLVIAGQVIGLSLIIAIGARDAGRTDLGAYAFAAGFGAVLLLRRRYPLAVLVVTVLGIFAYYALGYPPIGMAVPVAAALYATSVRGRAPATLTTGFVLLAVSLFFRARDHESSTVLAYDLLTNAALIGCAVALGLNVRGRRLAREQQETIVDLERAREQERAARELQAERVRIARDLHDSVGHALSVISVHAHVAREAPDARGAGRALDHIIDATGSSLHDLRTTLSLLRGPGDDGRTPPTLDGLEQILQAARDIGLEVHAPITADPARVPSPVASAAFRIVQESVTNVLRHTTATTLTVELTTDAATLHIRVTDDGGGTAEAGAVRTGRGIAGMRERAEALGGTFSAGDADGGFAVSVDLPLGGAA